MLVPHKIVFFFTSATVRAMLKLLALALATLVLISEADVEQDCQSQPQQQQEQDRLVLDSAMAQMKCVEVSTPGPPENMAVVTRPAPVAMGSQV